MINEITFKNEGYLYCKSVFYSSYNVLNLSMNFKFTTGVNKLFGEIDSGAWGISYLFSMYAYDVQKELFFNPLFANVDGYEIPLETLSKSCCYLDEKTYPLFSKKHKTVRNLIQKGLRKTKNNKTTKEICELFMLDPERIERPICNVGNEKFRAMAAIGYAHGKQIFCFPWMSQRIYNHYSSNILTLLDILEKLKKIVILPVEKQVNSDCQKSP